MEEKVLMEEMSWVEIEEAIRKGRTTVLLLSGSIEQHGPHLPTGTDTFLGYEVAIRAARKLGNALVAPVIRPALSEHHMAFPGSFSLSWETYRDLLEDYCESLARHGFKDVVMMSSHGGNNAVLKALTPDIARRLYDRIHIHLVLHIDKCWQLETAFLQKKGISPTKAGVHAGYGETSELLAVKPQLVKMRFAEEGLVDEDFFKPENIPRSQIDTFTLGIRHFSKNGILGDARGANGEIGEKLLEIAVETVVEEIRKTVGSSPR